MKKSIGILILLFLLVTGIKVNAQQQPRFTQYAFNPLFYNPAAAGFHGADIGVAGLYRNQWLGLEGAPVTQMITVDGTVKRKRIGLGLIVMNDVLGAVRQQQFSGEFSYRWRLGDFQFLSFGTSLGAYPTMLDPSKIKAANMNDVAIPTYDNVLWRPQVKLGIFYNSDYQYYGICVTDIYHRDLNYSEKQRSVSDDGSGTHVFLTAQYNYDLNEKFAYKQAVLLKTDFHAPIQLDFTPMIEYNKKVLLGLSYRFEESICGMLQYNLKDYLKCGVSYDYTTTALTNYNNGTFEIILAYTFFRNKEIMYNPRLFGKQ